MNDHNLEHSQSNENGIRQTHESQASELVHSLEKVQQIMDNAQFLRAGGAGLQPPGMQSQSIVIGNTAKFDAASHEFDRTARIQNAQLHQLDSAVIQAQIQLAGKADVNKLSSPQIKALEHDFQKEHAVLKELHRTAEAAEMRALGEVRMVLDNGGKLAAIEAATKQMSNTFAWALENAANRLDELQREKGTERAAMERNGMALCKFANTAARDSVVIPQDWGHGDRIALTLSPGQTKVFTGQVGAGAVLDVQVTTAGSKVNWNAHISGDAFFLSTNKNGEEIKFRSASGHDRNIQVTVGRTEGSTNTVIQENASHESKGSGGLHGSLGLNRGPLDARAGADFNGEMANRKADLLRLENRGAERLVTVSVHAEVCFDRPPRPTIEIIRGSRP